MTDSDMERLTERLVQACKKMCQHAISIRGCVECRREDVDEVEDILDEFPISYFLGDEQE